jgi:hypothetical protein
MKGKNGWWLLQGESALYKHCDTRTKALKTIYRAKGPTHIRFAQINPKRLVYLRGYVSGLWLDPTQIACNL